MTVRGTGETGRFSERLAFNDPDLKTPVHDEISRWLDDRLRYPPWSSAFFGYPREWNPGVIENYLSEAEACRLAQMERIDRESWRKSPTALTFDRPVPPAPEIGVPRLVDLTWERPLGNDRWVSGFIDIAAEYECVPYLHLRHGKQERHSEYGPCSTWEPAWESGLDRRTFAFEIKSSIPSLGELIRQIRYYQSKWKVTYFVVAPDNRHVPTLLAQGIGFIMYPDGHAHWPKGAQL